ncbi:hypothetical protein CHS0354_015099 [Potamilus streckersoni]|uniref:Discoidin domain-containing receptor 2 n=1 Tax=Potamilus streckersoni TaxID=2493646 RepID=A0AAE0WEU5_9BIVA|nr:hypothetical protein CHS0354_015099 [Potamilus streckersoni]
MPTIVPVSHWCFVYFLIRPGFFVYSLYLEECKNALGMQSHEIPDSALSASSFHDEKSVGPQNARIRTELHGGAWCPKLTINKGSYEYLQIDLERLMVITQVEVQGRFGNGKGKEYATHFLLEYQREDDGEWIRFKNKTGNEIFDGNSNTYIPEVRPVSPSIIGKRIRFIPYSRYPRTVCMRVEVYGCPWLDGIVAYDVRQGERRGMEVDLLDFTYDGLIIENYLTLGLGQLTDGEYGDTNFRFDQQDLGIKGYEWVGWKNDSVENGGPLEIKFKFDTIRNFISLTLHCNNFFSKEVKVIRRALAYFSIGGKYFVNEPFQYDVVPDNVVEHARNVTVPLNSSTGRFIKLKLFFDAKWIMISEVHFQSVVASGTFYPEDPPTTTQTTVTTSHDVLQKEPEKVEELDVQRSHAANRDSKSDDGVRKQKTTTSRKAPDEDYISIMIGALAGLTVILVVIIAIVIVRLRRRQNNARQSLSPTNDSNVAVKLNNVHGNSKEKIPSSNMYNVGTNDDNEDNKESVGKDVPIDYDESGVLTGRGLTVVMSPMAHNIQKSSLKNVSPSTTSVFEQTSNNDTLYAAADVTDSQVPNIPSLQGVSGNNIYAVPNIDLMVSIDYSLMEFPRRSLRFVEVLGKGQFGEVHLCEAFGITEYLQDDYIIKRRVSSPTLVAVKILRTNADDRARADFLREIKVMSSLKDFNIVRVLGVCTTEEPICMIVEYMQYGDLNQFLLDHVPETDLSASNAEKISYGCQIYMASQIASGMKYLESLNMVHRDLATRNCLVGSKFTIKISDFGMSRSLYSANYYRIEGRAVLPIRWMSWESILLGKFTAKSDVWSFGVTLWEILTFARDRPYEGFTDEQVIENAGRYYRNDNQQLCLPQPAFCPKEIYDLMLETWNRQESDRPSFREIHMFLLRKNIGYDPRHETMGDIDVLAC